MMVPRQCLEGMRISLGICGQHR